MFSLLRLHICLVLIKGDTTVASAQPDSNKTLLRAATAHKALLFSRDSGSHKSELSSLAG
jgi:hypothetical protein